MRSTKPVILTLLAAGTLGAATDAGATPAPLTPGDTVNPIPTFSGSTPPYNILADTGRQMMTANGMTVQFEQWAVSTSINPGGIVFAFAIATSNNPTSLGATLPGYANFMTSVEACDPFSSIVTCQTTATGMAARSSGTGDTLSFSALGTTAVSPPAGGNPTYFSNLNGIFTNASGWIDPHVTVTDDGTPFTFDGIAPKTTSGAPEPATLGLFALGLLGTGLARRRRRR